MKRIHISFEPVFIFSNVVRWTIRVLPVSAIAGSTVAFFLWALDRALHFRFDHPWLLFFLPLAGVFIYFLYRLFGKNSEAGTNLIMDEIHQPGGGVPARMAPLVLLTTVITHLFGGSAGREGTAVQIGGSAAQFVNRFFKLPATDVKILLMAGIAAGFGAVFGTPVAGAVFALEVLAIGKIEYAALMPCFIASVGADWVCRAWGIQHTAYHMDIIAGAKGGAYFSQINLRLLLTVTIAGVGFGGTGYVFTQISHAVKRLTNRYISVPWLIPVVGGVVIIGLAYALGTTDYLGLGVSSPDKHAVSILSCFHVGGASYLSWFWKLVFTAVTLGTGFKGGEVTPLFFIGAALGNTIAGITGMPVDLMAGLGFIAVFAGASNTPLACTLMGVELFGGGNVIYFAIACFTSYYFSGHTGIYGAQRMGTRKFTSSHALPGETLEEIRKKNRNERG